MHVITHVRRPLALSLLLVAGCGADPGDLDPGGAVVSPIVNGSPASEGAAAAAGVVRVNGCVGALLRNDWVLVPRACVPVAQRVDPTTIQVSYGAQTSVARAVITAVQPSGEHEYLYVRTASPFVVDGSTFGFVQTLGDATTGQDVSCWSYNAGQYNRANLPATYGGYYSSGVLTYVAPNSAGQSLSSADLGAPCFNAAGNLVGVAYTFSGQTPSASLLRPVTAAPFTQRILGGAAPDNDTRATAIPIKSAYYDPGAEMVYGGSTAGASADGPSGAPCGCVNGGANVWYSIQVGSGTYPNNLPEVIYLDTSGSDFDTSLAVTDANGTLLAGQAGTHPNGFCNDDAQCSGSGFGSSLESRVVGVLQPGTYYISVSGCGTGRYALHVQRRAFSAASITAGVPIAGDSAVFGQTAGASASQDTCGGSPSAPENAEWFVSCGGRPQLFSLCPSDGGSYRRQLGSTYFDPTMSLQSAATGQSVLCNDDGPTQGGTDCRGTGGDGSQYGSRLAAPIAPRGLNAVVVDNRAGTSGMSYLLRYTVR